MRESLPCVTAKRLFPRSIYLPYSKPRANMFTPQDLGIKEHMAIKERGKAFTMCFHHDSLREMDSNPIISILYSSGGG